MTDPVDPWETTPQMDAHLHERAALVALNQGAWRNMTSADYGVEADLGFIVAEGKRPCRKTLEKILGPTFGFIAFREQILALAEAISDFDRVDLAALWSVLPKIEESCPLDPSDEVGLEGTDGAILDSLRRAFIERRRSPWERDEVRRVWGLMMAGAPDSMPAADAYRSAALAIVDERLGALWTDNVRAATGQGAV